MEIQNYEDVVLQLTELLIGFDKTKNDFQTDVYLYVNKETKTAVLHTFPNPSGRSWIDDDHYTIYRDIAHCEGYEEVFDDLELVAEAIGISTEKLLNNVLSYYEEENPECISFGEVWEYIRQDDLLCEKLTAAYNSYVDDHAAEYNVQAEHILDNFLMEN